MYDISIKNFHKINYPSDSPGLFLFCIILYILITILALLNLNNPGNIPCIKDNNEAYNKINPYLKANRKCVQYDSLVSIKCFFPNIVYNLINKMDSKMFRYNSKDSFYLRLFLLDPIRLYYHQQQLSFRLLDQ